MSNDLFIEEDITAKADTIPEAFSVVFLSFAVTLTDLIELL